MAPMNQGSTPKIVFTADQPATFSRTPRGMAMVTFAQMPRCFVLQRRTRVDECGNRRGDHDPEAFVPAARRDKPGQDQRDRVGDPREHPRFAHADAAAGQRTFRLVDAIDLEVVDLVERVVAGVEHGRHQRAEGWIEQELGVQRIARWRAGRRDRAGDEAERGRDQRERTRELQPELANASRQKSREQHRQQRGDGRIQEVQQVVVHDAWCLQRRAERALGEGADRRRQHDRERAHVPGRVAAGRASDPSTNAPIKPAAVPSSDTAPDVPGGTWRNVGTRYGLTAPGLADLARDRIAASGGQRRGKGDQRRSAPTG